MAKHWTRLRDWAVDNISDGLAFGLGFSFGLIYEALVGF